MVRKLSLLLGLLFFVSFTAHAQDLSDKVEVFGGYSFMHNDNRPDGNLNGWELSGQYKFTGWLGAVADFDGHYGGGTSVISQLLFGPQVSFPARVSPFAHVLVGGAHEHMNGVGSDTSFAAAVGGGIDAKLSRADLLARNSGRLDSHQPFRRRPKQRPAFDGHCDPVLAFGFGYGLRALRDFVAPFFSSFRSVHSVQHEIHRDVRLHFHWLTAQHSRPVAPSLHGSFAARASSGFPSTTSSSRTVPSFPMIACKCTAPEMCATFAIAGYGGSTRWTSIAAITPPLTRIGRT